MSREPPGRAPSPQPELRFCADKPSAHRPGAAAGSTASQSRRPPERGCTGPVPRDTGTPGASSQAVTGPPPHSPAGRTVPVPDPSQETSRPLGH